MVTATLYMGIGGYVAWFAVHCLMLTIFVKYGKPLEDDEKTLIENKLIEKFEESQDVDLKRERKIKAYNDLAELQVEAFIRTMRTYTNVK